MYYCAFCSTISRWTNVDHYKCMHFCSVGLNFWIWFLFVNLPFLPTKKKRKKNLIWKISLFLAFFLLVSTDVITESADFGIMFKDGLFPLSSFFLFFFIVCFSWEQFILQELKWCIREELLPYLTLRRCWKQRLKKRTDREDTRTDLIMRRAATLGNVLLNNNQLSTQRQNASNISAWDFIFVFDIPGGTHYFFGCWMKERERDWYVLVTLWSHSSRKNWEKIHNPTVLAS